ncbi:hypothetical protein V494_00286 [Pseudogymnoascus sp. VKM F-4513 (FW-928)]|nr:hypothetical protein V494_00286 [Pseudogymnoascus sp. VKM F-4513 (FW-928)]
MDGEPRNAASTAYRGDGAVPVQRSRSLRRLLSGRHGAPAPITSSPTSMYPPTPNFPAAPRPQQLVNTQRQRDLEQESRTQRSASNDSYHTHGNPSSYTKNKRPMPSEAARLRSLNTGQRSPSNPESPYRQDMAPPRENFSRPRQASTNRTGDPPRTAPSSGFVVPQQSRGGNSATRPEFGRDRGFSESPASMSSGPSSSRPLRNAYSIPELSAADQKRNGLGNPANSRNGMKFRDNSPNPELRPTFPGASNDEQVRESLRSVQTSGTGTTAATWDTPTSSVFLDTARSSVLSKASSAKSVNGRDQIDDFLDMYEGGFGESEVEAEDETHPSRPPTSRSAQSEIGNKTTIPDLDGTTDLPPPKLQHMVIRDSTDMFRTRRAYVDPFNVDSDEDTGSNQQKPPPGISRQPSGRGVIGAQYSKFDSSRDHYGFKKKSLNVPPEAYEAWNRDYTVYLARRRRKWVDVMKSNGLGSNDPTRFPPKTNKMKRFVRKGIPPDWRGEAWFWYAGGHKILAKNPGVYDNLVHRAANGDLSPTDEEIIERDLHRTFPDNIMFKPDPVVSPIPVTGEKAAMLEAVNSAETPILMSLRRVLQATAIHNPKIGYCQSLNFLAGLLLLFMCEERAFWMLDLITKEFLPGTHEVNLEGANVDLGVLMMCVIDAMPAVWFKIGSDLDGSFGPNPREVPLRLPPITLCCTAWFMSCFIGTLPIETTLRVWDSFFFEGSKTLFRIALAVFKVGEAEIRAINDPMEVFQVVQTIPRRLVDANALMDACYRRRNGFGHVTQNTIDDRRALRRQMYADDRAEKNKDKPRPSSKRSNLSKRSLFSTIRGRK